MDCHIAIDEPHPGNDRLFEFAMKWRLIPVERNPMSLVEVRGASIRRRRPRILSPEQFLALVAEMPKAYAIMIKVAAGLGLRVSEVVALKWSDINFERRTVMVVRASVHAHVDAVKSEYAEDELPLDDDLASQLLAWRCECELTADGWIFPSSTTGKPYHAGSIQKRYIRPAGLKLGLGDGLGWHALRHT